MDIESLVLGLCLVLVLILVLLAVLLCLTLRPIRRPGEKILGELLRSDESIRNDIARQTALLREENANHAQSGRMENNERHKELRYEIGRQLSQLEEQMDKLSDTLNHNLSKFQEQLENQSKEQREELRRTAADQRIENRQSLEDFRQTFGERQKELIDSTEKKLEEMRATVDEKLQKTLNERIGQSFRLVSEQLENVQKGLGDMQHLASDVGGLKRVLSNVKVRGTFGEIQLQALLEQMLSPEQYDSNVRTAHTGNDRVEFAVRLPGKDDSRGFIYLPIDAKFPKDIYEQYLDACELAEPALVEEKSKLFENTLRKMAKDIRDKYIDPPYTTDFAILFLPFENIYAEAIRRSALMDELQQKFKVAVTGPTTLGAILNSLQVGFRTLALQKRSSEVWSILGAVKTEFGKFEALLDRAQKNLSSASSAIDEMRGKRTRAIIRRLEDVESLPESDSSSRLSLEEYDTDFQ